MDIAIELIAIVVKVGKAFQAVFMLGFIL